MELIDRDALLDDAIERYCKNCDRRKGVKNGKWRIIYEIGDAPCRACSVDDMKCEIEDAPTVDAIPIAWLEEKLTNHPEIPYVVTDGINVVLDMWREENGSLN